MSVLHDKADEVTRLVRAHPSFRGAVARGLDPDELLQDVWTVLLSRQEPGRRSRFDPARAQPQPRPRRRTDRHNPDRAVFCNYIGMVTRSAVSHALERAATKERHGTVGVLVEDDFSWKQDQLFADKANPQVYEAFAATRALRHAGPTEEQQHRVELDHLPVADIVSFLAEGHSEHDARRAFPGRGLDVEVALTEIAYHLTGEAA